MSEVLAITETNTEVSNLRWLSDLRDGWIGLSLLCSKIYLLFLPELPKIFTHYSFLFP